MRKVAFVENRCRVAFITLGCKVNSNETEGMRTLFEAAGYQAVPGDSAADVYVVNTCSVTSTGDRKSRQMIRRARSLNPAAVVAAVGCYAQMAPEEVAALTGADLVLGNNQKHRVVELVGELLGVPARRDSQIAVMPRGEMTGFEALPISDFTGQSRAFMKIQDGCDCFCSYCIIPYVRGPVRNRNMADVLDEAARLAGKGFSELVLTGIHLTSFRNEQGEEGLTALLRAFDKMDGIRRVRLGSLEPAFLTGTILDELAECRKFCPHFHLSLQSGSEAVLRRMNRHYAPEEYLAIVNAVRSHFPDASVTTDVMVGFPGETEDEFEESFSFCGAAGFSWMHVFPYSPRRGTPAAGWPGQVPKSVKETRAGRMRRLAEGMRTAFQHRFIGREMLVHFECVVSDKPGWMEGFTENYIQVEVPATEFQPGDCFMVRLEESAGDRMKGVLLTHGNSTETCYGNRHRT
jgi:threonylcarbamoyladenosine tRNA methylthiotransferase MtaB